MVRLHGNGFCLLALWCGWAYPAVAQRIAPAQVDKELRADKTSTDVYVNDSFEAADNINKATVLAQRRQWSDAASLLQRVSDTSGDRLVRVSPGFYIGIRERINQIIAAWPQAGLDAYRTLFESEIRNRLSARRKPWRTDELLNLFHRYFCTASAAGLADRIGQQAIESGDLVLAEHVYRRVNDDHPDRSDASLHNRAMLALLAAMRGDSQDARPARVDQHRFEPPPKVTLRWMGKERALDDILTEVRNGFHSLRAQPSSLEWPTFFGSGDRNRPSTTRVDRVGLLWRFDVQESSAKGSVEEESSNDTEEQRSRRLSMQPVVSGDLIYVQLFREIVAVHRRTGMAAWRFLPKEGDATAVSYLEDSTPRWDSVTVVKGRLYASLPGERVAYYSYESPRNPSELVCLDAQSGRVIWRLDQQVIEDRFSEISFDSSPLVQRDRLFVVGRRRRSFGFEDCYLYCFDARTGALRYQTHLGSASTGTFGSRQATFSVAALHDDTIYVCSNLGTVAAVSIYSGSVRWLRLYPRDGGDGPAQPYGAAKDAKPWQFNPIFYEDGRLIVLPTDAARVLVLAADDGRLLQAIPRDRLDGMNTLFGLRGNLLCGAGERIVCYDLDQDQLRWSRSWPQGAQSYGRGAWVDDRLLVPTRRRLLSFRVSDGQQGDTRWNGRGEGGNLLALPDQILVAGVGRLEAYVRKQEIREALRKRMAASPADPLPALEWAEVSLNNGERHDAVAGLDEAVRRAGELRQPPDSALDKRIFTDVLLFADRLVTSQETSEKSNLPQLDTLFQYASSFATDTEAQVRYRFRFAKYFDHYGRIDREIQLYHQVLRDRSLREEPAVAEQTNSADRNVPVPLSAGAQARARIADLIAKHGRSLYEPYEAQARQWLQQGRATGDERILQRIVDTFPNSRTAVSALIAQGELLARRGQPAEAALRFSRAYHRYPKQVDRPMLLRKIADAYEQAGQADNAYRWLTKAAREHPTHTIDYEGRSMTFLQYRRRLAHVRERVEPLRPVVRPPLNHHFEQEFDDKATLLEPRFGDEPGSSWRSYYVYTPATLHAFESATGRPLWSIPFSVRGRPTPELLLVTPQAAIFETAYRILALDVSSGHARWSYGDIPQHLDDANADWEDTDPFRVSALQGRKLLSVRSHGEMSCLDIDTGKLLWSQTHRPVPQGAIHVASPWVVYDVVQDARAVICLVDLDTGEWFDAFKTDEEQAVEDLFVTLDRQVIVATSQSLLAYDPRTRERRWRIPLAGQLHRASLAVDVDALYFSDDGRRVQKVGVEDGRLLWTSASLVARGDDTMNVQLQGGSVLVTSEWTISAVDAVTGLTQWRIVAGNRRRFISRLLTASYLLTVDSPRGPDDGPALAHFYDHRNGSGAIPQDGGTVTLGPFTHLRAAMALDRTLLIQTDSTIRGWTHQP